jgi:uncharacterized membrane protein (Fun14 family)
VAIDNIAAATSPLLTSVGFSGLIGFLIGYAIKKVMKILAVGAGMFFAASTRIFVSYGMIMMPRLWFLSVIPKNINISIVE